MRYFLYLLLFPFLLCACNISKDDNVLSFNGAKISSGDEAGVDVTLNSGWYSLFGKATIDSVTTYVEGLHSVSLHSSEKYGVKVSSIVYNLNSEEVYGDSIYFKANFKAQARDSMSVYLGISQLLSTGNSLTDTVKIECSNTDTEWFELETSAKMDDQTVRVQFFYHAVNEGKIWTTNWQAKIDNQPLGAFVKQSKAKIEDSEFDESSKITLESLTPQMIENLEVLGKVWGFLKYYHPAVIRNSYNWDYELFRILPKVVDAKNKTERSKVLKKWIDDLGKFKEGNEFVIDDEAKYSRIIDLNWICNEEVFSKGLISTLVKVKNGDRSKIYNAYVLSPNYGSMDNNSVEKQYSNIKWEDQGYRILTLFRLWNAIEYCFPYVNLMDESWAPLLKEYIPQIADVKSKTAYEQSLIKLFSHVDESHGWINIPNHSLRSKRLLAHHWAQWAPFKMTRTAEGEVLVLETQCEEVKRGDVIVKVEGRDIHEIVKEKGAYIASSNEATLYRDVLPSILSYYSLPFTLTVKRDGHEIEQSINTQLVARKNKVGLQAPESYNLKKYNIGYIDVSKTSTDEIKDILKQNTKGVILDLRIYPNGDAFRTLVSLLTEKASPYVWFSNNIRNEVGNYRFKSEYKTQENTNYYKGKVAILVNEGTQSHGEFSAMAYSKAPRSVTIGSQTAGADGNIQRFHLPGNILITYTGLGTYYPNWEMCQRVGVKIDIPVYPTIKGVKDGRDELLEEGIKYIVK